MGNNKVAGNLLQINSDLFLDIQKWLKLRGKVSKEPCSKSRPGCYILQPVLHSMWPGFVKQGYFSLKYNRKCLLQTCRPKLTDEQKAQLRTCFDLMDADGSGAIDAEELTEAFDLLGMNYTRAEIQVSHHASSLTPPV